MLLAKSTVSHEAVIEYSIIQIDSSALIKNVFFACVQQACLLQPLDGKWILFIARKGWQLFITPRIPHQALQHKLGHANLKQDAATNCKNKLSKVALT